MRTVSAEELSENWEEFIGYINTYITGDRQTKLKDFYETYQERIMTMPASSFEQFHNAFPGGYLLHINNVIRCAIKLAEVWKQMGSPLNFTHEELVFSAINHDLGKFGSIDEEYYVPNPSDWHRKNQGKIYETNGKLGKMPIQDRSLFLLQQAGIEMNYEEYIAIKTHDGMYDESNGGYLNGFTADSKLKTSLHYVLNQADMMAARIEYEDWRDNYSSTKSVPKNVTNSNYGKTSSTSKKLSSIAETNGSKGNATKLFNELFND